MNISILSSKLEISHAINPYLILNKSYWEGHVVTLVKKIIDLLQDRRFASTFIFTANFFLLEIICRLNHLIQRCLPDFILTNKRWCLFPLEGAIITVSNIILIKITKIKIHPIIITFIFFSSLLFRLEVKKMFAN